MSLRKINFILFVNILLFSACHNSYYFPKEVNDLKLKNQDDLNASISFTPNGRNLQLGYSPIKHLGIFGNHFKKDNNNNWGSIWKENTIGVGSYFFQKKKNPSSKQFSLLRGHGFTPGILLDGYATYSFGQWGYQREFFYNFYFRKIAFQTGIHFQDSLGCISVFYRIGRTKYHRVDLGNNIAGNALDHARANIENNTFTPHTFAINFTMGIKQVRTYFNLNFITNDFDLLGNKPYLSGNLGFTANLNEIYQTFKNK